MTLNTRTLCLSITDCTAGLTIRRELHLGAGQPADKAQLSDLLEEVCTLLAIAQKEIQTHEIRPLPTAPYPQG